MPARKKQVGTAFVQDNDGCWIRDDPVRLNLRKSHGDLQRQCPLASLGVLDVGLNGVGPVAELLRWSWEPALQLGRCRAGLGS